MNKAEKRHKKKAVAIWLLVGVFMIMIQIVLGGVTRLTGSGLSITEWKPIMGFLPPMGAEEWNEAFNKYKEIAQFKYVNNHFTLSDFKFIYYWEWFHRIWARSLGVVFAIPFVYFLIKKYFLKEMILPLIILFVLGGLQGFIGWFMVQSGLDESSLLYVSHVRLSIHFVSALVLLIYALWFALKLLIPKHKIVKSSSTRRYFLFYTVVLTVQLFYGAFMAGLHAAKIAPSWPKMNGRWIPPNLSSQSWINHAVNVQFVHRGLAYLLFILTVIGFIKIRKMIKEHPSALLRKTGNWMMGLLVTQILLGIFTLLSVPTIERGHFGWYELLAEVHQVVGMGLLMSIFVILYIVRNSTYRVE